MAREPSQLLIVSGPPGAGKSTVAKLLVESLPAPAAYLEGDQFWKFIVKSGQAGEGASLVESRTEDFRILIQAMTAAAVRYANGGYDTVLDFSIPPRAMEAIARRIRETPLSYVILCPSVEVCAARAASRPVGTLPDYADYREFHGAFAGSKAFERHTIRDDDATPAQLAAQIRAGVAAGAFRVPS